MDNLPTFASIWTSQPGKPAATAPDFAAELQNRLKRQSQVC